MGIIDLHCDTISALMDCTSEIGLQKNHLHIDIEKLRKAQSLAQLFAMYLDLHEVDNPSLYCNTMIDRFYSELLQNQNAIKPATNYNEFVENNNAGFISAFLTIEEGGVLEGDIENLYRFYQRGVRLITLTWNYPNEIGYPNHEFQYQNNGLSDFGFQVVREMNRLGMIVDVSHLSDKGFYDVAAISTKPFIASHSNARSVKNHSRNLTDEMIKCIAEKGGVIGINFANIFLGTSPVSRIEDIIRHIKYIAQVGGIDVIALGSDFDGIDPHLEINNISEIHKLIDALQVNNFCENDIEKICSTNATRLLRECLG